MMVPDFNFTDFNTFLAKAEGRDKICRMFQFGMRALFGATNWTAPRAGTGMATLSENSRAMMVALTACRRCHRWCKEIAVIQSIPKTLEIANPVDRLLELLTKGSLATFMITDHIGHLKQLKILSGGKRSGSGTIQLGMSYFGLANICMAIVTAKKIFALKGDDDGVAKQRRTLYETLFKQFLMVFQMAHLSLIYVSHDAFVGLAGVISSYMDAVPQWPAPKPVAAVENGKAK